MIYGGWSLFIVGLLMVMGGCAQAPKVDLTTVSAIERKSPADAKPTSSSPTVIQASFVDAEPQSAPQTTPPKDTIDNHKKDATPSRPTNPLAIGGSKESLGGPLSLDEVLKAVETHFPLLQAVEQERAIAGGRLISTLGAFDFNLLASGDANGSTYENYRSSMGVAQMLPFGGINVFGGYRNGYGDFPSYNLGGKTADGGEFRAGLSVPLLRDREIDRPRAAVQQARLDVAIAEPTIDRQRLDFQRAATRTYWNWVAAGQRLKATEELLTLAFDRDEQIKARIAAGRQAGVDRVDNEQNIVLRNGLLVQAQRAFQQATIELSLFLRDETGQPTLAGMKRMIMFPAITPIEANSFDSSLQSAFENRPEPKRLRFQKEKLAVDLRLAVNQAMPSVNATLSAAQDVGVGKSSLSGSQGLDRSTVNAGLMFQFPVQQREARGRELAARAQLVQIEQLYRQAEDIVRAEVQDTFSAVERAYEFYKQASKRVILAQLVAEAERELFRLGNSDVLRVTLREQAAFEAEIFSLTAMQDYHRSIADFQAAIGRVN